MIRNRSGIATLIMVLVVSIIGLFVLVAWQSRLLVAIQRQQSLSDLLVVNYAAESEMYDWVARFIGNYSDIFNSDFTNEKTLADGTKLTVAGDVEGNKQNLIIKSKRQFSTTNLLLQRETSYSSESNFDRVEIVLGIDCSGSMDRNANPDCTGAGCTRRIYAAKTALLSFVNKVNSITPASDRDKYYVGVNVYRKAGNWLSYLGQQYKPTNNHGQLYTAIDNTFGSSWGESSACRDLQYVGVSVPNGGGETNIGHPAKLANEYFNQSRTSNSSQKIKQIYVTITDGLPNVSLEDSFCGTPRVACNDGGPCTQDAINYLRCYFAKDTFAWQAGPPTRYGGRYRDVDLYAVSVAKPNPNISGEVEAFAQTEAAFSSNDFTTKYYPEQNANKLPEILDDIFSQIQNNLYKITLKKVTPTP